MEPIEEHRAGFGPQGSRHPPCPGRIRGPTRMTAEPVSSPKAVIYARGRVNLKAEAAASVPRHLCIRALGAWMLRWGWAARAGGRRWRLHGLSLQALMRRALPQLPGKDTPLRHQHMHGFSGPYIRLHHPHLHSLSSL